MLKTAENINFVIILHLFCCFAPSHRCDFSSAHNITRYRTLSAGRLKEVIFRKLFLYLPILQNTEWAINQYLHLKLYKDKILAGVFLMHVQIKKINLNDHGTRTPNTTLGILDSMSIVVVDC